MGTDPAAPTNTPRLEIIPLGGAAEIGKNMIVVRFGDDIVVIDTGVTFPTPEHPGIDLIIPDIGFLVDNAEHLRAIILTHGHEDHIGALPFVLKQVRAPVYGTRLTMGFVREKLDEHGLLHNAELHTFAAGDRLAFGAIEVEPIQVTHSIPDTVSLALHTPVGTVVHSGDFKIDHTPIDNRHFDAARFAELGDDGVLLLISDTVNAEKPGSAPSERTLGAIFDQHFRDATGRILITTFASNIHRIQQFCAAADRYGRRIAVAGRSMERNMRVAKELGYLNFPSQLRIDVGEIDNYPPHQVAIITTGSQGEPMSALSRIASDSHKIHVGVGDTVILSSTPIPGNEDAVWRTVNRLIRRGAEVVYELLTPVHASGHAYQDELKLLYRLTRPLYVVPFHGEPRMMVAYTRMVTEMGMPEDRVLWLDNGDALALDGTEAEILEQHVPSGSVFVDGMSEGGASDLVLRDRRHLAFGGTVVVTVAIDSATGAILDGPDIISRGFLRPDESDRLFDDARALVVEALDALAQDDDVDPETAQTIVRDTTARFLKKKTGRRPVVVPVIMEI